MCEGIKKYIQKYMPSPSNKQKLKQHGITTIFAFSDLFLLLISLYLFLLIPMILIDPRELAYSKFISIAYSVSLLYIFSFTIMAGGVYFKNKVERLLDTHKEVLRIRHFIVLFFSGIILVSVSIKFGKGFYYSPLFFIPWFFVTYFYWNNVVLKKIREMTGKQQTISYIMTLLSGLTGVIIPIISFFDKYSSTK
ncbi:hypothetical protein [Leuconostoc pseudomesenteroides]|uniref:hypothetical protein n=1 Tax=Leuconostoc pseudomesenteroides TaxID=33968 RepID=UPI00403630A1